MNLIPLSGEGLETPTQLSRLERVKPTELMSPSLHLKKRIKYPKRCAF